MLLFATFSDAGLSDRLPHMQRPLRARVDNLFTYSARTDNSSLRVRSKPTDDRPKGLQDDCFESRWLIVLFNNVNTIRPFEYYPFFFVEGSNTIKIVLAGYELTIDVDLTFGQTIGHCSCGKNSV